MDKLLDVVFDNADAAHLQHLISKSYAERHGLG